MEAAQELLSRRRARKTFSDFCRYVAPDEPPAKHHEYLCGKLDQVVEGSIRRLMIFLPPGSAKSTYASVRFPAYLLGKRPRLSIIAASYGQDLATSFGRKVRNLVDTVEYRCLFPEIRLSNDQKAKGEWGTTSYGAYFAAGVGTGVTGRRADLAIIDDPIKGRQEADSETVRNSTWEWYKSDLFTRLKPNAAQIWIMTRWHEDDPAGRILPKGWNGESGVFKGYDGQDWHVVCIPAEARENDPLGRLPGEYLWPEWFTPQFWEETKAAQQATDIRNWISLYQQVPRSEEGTFFKREWFKRYRVGDQPERLTVYGASDYAVTDGGGDYTEQGIVGFDMADDLWVLDWWSGQKSADVWINEQFKLVKKHKPLVWIAESGVIRRSIEPFLEREQRNQGVYYRTEWITSYADKAANARGFQALASQGKVFIPSAPWGDELIEQLVSFPAGKYDDKVDVCGLFGRILDQAFAPRVLPKPESENLDAWGRRFAKDANADSWKTR